MDLYVTMIGTAASVPTAARGTAATLVARGGERWLVRLRRGHPAPTAALGSGSAGSRSRAAHPPARRPLPRGARPAQDLRTARTRAAPPDRGAARPHPAHDDPAPGDRPAPLRRGPGRGGAAPRGGDLGGGRLPDRGRPHAPLGGVGGLRRARGRAPRRVRRRGGPGARRARGPGLGTAPARRAGDGRGRANRQLRPGARAPPAPGASSW